MIAPRACQCGSAMEWRAKSLGAQARPGTMMLGAYLCHHCDAPCAGVAGPGRCEACDRMKVKR